MDLLSDEKKEKENKGKKIVISALIISVVLIILVLVMILILKQQENDKTKLTVDGKKQAFSESFLIVDENEQINYFSIKQVAQYVGYNFYNGGYKKYSEDKTKCYVENSNEIATFEAGSKVIYKNSIENKLNFDAYEIDQTIKSKDGELYATANAIQTAFDIRVTHEKRTNTIHFETLPYLVNYYESVAQNYGYTGISTEFANEKALTREMLVVNKNGKYGVVSTNNFLTIIGNKYDEIVYLENTHEFIAKNEGKTGLLSIDGETKIALKYEDVGLIDGTIGLYYTKNNNLYGIVNSNGKILNYNEFEKIGIDRSVFNLGDMINNYILYDNCIPLKKDGKWGMVDKYGNEILKFEYDTIGYVDEQNTQYNLIYSTPNATTQESEGNINNVVVIPSIEGIVFGIGNKYGVVDSIGKVIIPFKNDKIFSATSEGVDEFFLERSGVTMSISKYMSEYRANVERTPTATPKNVATPTVAPTPVKTKPQNTKKPETSNDNDVLIIM